MSNPNHRLIKYNTGLPFDNSVDIVTKVGFVIGESVVSCDEKNSLILLRSLKDNNYECPFCRKKLNKDLIELRNLRVFLCHAHEDKSAVRDLYKHLTADGVDAWLDQEKLTPGQDWRVEIPKAIRDSDIVIICLSKNSINKEGYVNREIRFALDVADEYPRGTIFIVPARLEECKVPDQLDMYHWVDLFQDNGYAMLIRALAMRATQIGMILEIKRSWSPIARPSTPNEKQSAEARVRAEELTKEVRKRATELAAEVRERGKSAVEAVRKSQKSEDEAPAKENKSSPNLDVSGNVSGSVVVAGSNNVINMGTRTRGFLIPKQKDLEKEKSHVSEERVLEAAIEKQVNVGRPASLFVWIRRHESKNIISVVSSIDEYVQLDEENVKAKKMEIEFPVENGKTFSAGITIRLVAHEFVPSEQQKKIIVPPKGDSEVCIFIVTPKREGELLLSLEVLKDDVSLANRNLRTLAIGIEKKVDNTLLLVTIPIIILVQESASILSEATAIQGKEAIEAKRQSYEKAKLERLEQYERAKIREERDARVEALPARRKESYSAPNMSPRTEKAPPMMSSQKLSNQQKTNSGVFKYGIALIISFVMCIGLYLIISYIYPWLQNIIK